MKTKVTNTSKANQGVWTEDGLVHLAPGETRALVIAEDYVDRAKALPFLTLAGGDDSDAAEPGPLDGSVDDLAAHLETVDDPDEVQALIDAETGGKSRKGALAALEARRDELLA